MCTGLLMYKSLHVVFRCHKALGLFLALDMLKILADEICLNFNPPTHSCFMGIATVVIAATKDSE
jgi:hypothetical protein